MDSVAQRTADAATPCLIPDVRGISLRELKSLASVADDAVEGAVARKVGGLESPSVIPAMMFNAAVPTPDETP